MNFLKNTSISILTLEADDSQELKRYMDIAFAAHPDMKSQAVAVFTLGKDALIFDSTNKNSKRSSTEAELNGIDDKINKTFW